MLVILCFKDGKHLNTPFLLLILLRHLSTETQPTINNAEILGPSKRKNRGALTMCLSPEGIVTCWQNELSKYEAAETLLAQADMCLLSIIQYNLRKYKKREHFSIILVCFHL